MVGEGRRKGLDVRLDLVGSLVKVEGEGKRRGRRGKWIEGEGEGE